MSFDIFTRTPVCDLMVAGMLGANAGPLFGKQEHPGPEMVGSPSAGASSVAIWTIGGAALGEPLSLALHALGFVACGMVWNASRAVHGRKPNCRGRSLARSSGRHVLAAPSLVPAMRLIVGAAIVAIYAGRRLPNCGTNPGERRTRLADDPRCP